ncbi:MAG: TIM barrel protein [Rhizomicrobium sp.]|nr:TIM barrel protein [Rhizomicrobium sp.]
MAVFLPHERIELHNGKRLDGLHEEYHGLGRTLQQRGIDIAAIKRKVAAFSVAIPSWGLTTGGTRFGRFPIPGEPTNLRERLQDCAVVQQLCRITPRVSTHFPWDHTSDPVALKEETAALGLGFDAVNSNTFQDQPGQAATYKFGSLTASDQKAREQAVAHNIDCIEIGKKLGAEALTVWIGDGTNFPGQQSFRASFDRYMQSTAQIYAALPADWRMLLEHKICEPAFYSTVISDWGTSLMAATELGPKAACLVDLGHHAPNVNIEQIVAMLNRVGKLGGFHFNDSKYGDDDLDAGAINPHQLFLIFNELVEADLANPAAFNPAYMIDESHNLTDPVESLFAAAEAIAGAYARALLIDREALKAARDGNDVMMAFRSLRRAYNVDVTPILALARVEAGGAADPVVLFRESGYRSQKAAERKTAAIEAGII